MEVIGLDMEEAEDMGVMSATEEETAMAGLD